MSNNIHPFNKINCWLWNNYTIMDKSYPQDKEKHINLYQGDSFFNNKKEMLKDTKRVSTSLNERMPILQKNSNPFIGNNYLDHLDTEQEFLRAKSSNIE